MILIVFDIFLLRAEGKVDQLEAEIRELTAKIDSSQVELLVLVFFSMSFWNTKTGLKD